MQAQSQPKQSLLIDPKRIRFARLQPRTAVTPAPANDLPRFKSDFYVFCMHTQTDASSWDVGNLSHWQFFLLSEEALLAAGIGQSISLSRLNEIQALMSATALQMHAKQELVHK